VRFTLLQEVSPESPLEVGNASPTTASPKGGRNDDVTVHTNTPPPPFRGALPSAQPVASPSIAPTAPLPTIAHHLLSDTDAAIARQTLLQVASLPDHLDIASVRLDPTAPRWNFEIPFATVQGTAIAQFEISRDGGGGEVEATKRVWRARFSLDIEPAGPVHALVSLSGERTSVRMWAERPATAAQLRADASRLSQALSEAELQPGDIVIRDGAPPQPAPAPAGHFLNRAMSGGTGQLAVALHYDKKGAPRVVAKGKGSIGEKIIGSPKPTISMRRTKCWQGTLKVELGDEIPQTLQGGGGSAGLCVAAVGAIRFSSFPIVIVLPMSSASSPPPYPSDIAASIAAMRSFLPPRACWRRAVLPMSRPSAARSAKPGR
jgi:type III secretion system FlhB-like substrate exporter